MSRFRLKVREAQPLVVESDQGNGLAALAGRVINSLVDIAEDLAPPTGLAEGNRAPDFRLTTVDGETLQLSDLRGNIVLLNFWGTWCGPCRREMPEFQKAYEDRQDQGFEILAVAFNDTEAAIKDFRDEFGLTFLLALDDSGEVNNTYAVQTRPSTYVIDRDGVITLKHFGIMTEPQLREIFHDAFPDK